MEPIVYPLNGRRIYVAGDSGMVGRALVRRLPEFDCEILTIDRNLLDLRRQSDVDDWFATNRPDTVFIAAATVGGILANDTRPAEFLYDNLLIGANLVEAARRTGVKKLMFLGSSCIYPRQAPQPIPEEALLSGPLEPTNEAYAIAKIAGMKLCASYRRQYGCDYISAMPTNLYGPGDTFNLASSHVIPALIAKIHAAKVAGESEVEIWGTGTPKREFLHVYDLADSLLFLMQRYSADEHVNVGSGDDVAIDDLAHLIALAVGYTGGFRFRTTMPDGMPRKLLDSKRLNEMGWHPRIDLMKGLADAYRWYCDHVALPAAKVAA